MQDYRKRNILWAAADKAVVLTNGQNAIYCAEMVFTENGATGLFGGYTETPGYSNQMAYNYGPLVRVTV